MEMCHLPYNIFMVCLQINVQSFHLIIAIVLVAAVE